MSPGAAVGVPGRARLTGEAAAATAGLGRITGGYVNRDPVPARSPVRGWGYFLAAFFLRSAQ